MKRLFPVFLVVLTCLFGCASTDADASFIEVSGTAVIHMNADEATFTVSSEAVADTTDEARAETDRIINTAISILKDSYGVLDEDLVTGYLSLSPYYEWKDSNRILSGQRGYQSVDVTIDDISRVGEIVEALSHVNGISVSSIKLDKADKSSEIEQARAEAVSNAIAKARTYAVAAGKDIGDVVFITDSVSDYGRSYANDMYMAEAAPKSAGGTNYYAYDLTVTDTVHIRVEMD